MKHSILESVYVKFRNQQCLAVVLEFVKDFCAVPQYFGPSRNLLTIFILLPFTQSFQRVLNLLAVFK